MRISVLLVAVIPTFALIQASAAETESAITTTSAPGKVEMAQVVEGSAVIAAIDKAKRTFDVKRQNGDEVTIDAGPGLKSHRRLEEYGAALVQSVRRATASPAQLQTLQ